MDTIHLRKTTEEDGEITMTGLPYRKGDEVHLTVSPVRSQTPMRQRLTAGALRRSGLIGLWKNREDIQDSAAYSRQLRERAQRRWE